MEFRRSGQRDDRRRRLFAEELGPARGAWRGNSASDGAAEGRRNYGDGAFLRKQPRVIDLIPRKLGKLAIWAAAGVAVILGLEVLHIWATSESLSSLTTDGRIATFDLDSEGSLAVWFSSMLLAVAALVAVLVYSVRRHKRDDYQGNYRIWLWAAMCWLILSLDECASLHEGFKEMMAWMTGTRLLGDGSLWWIAPYVFLLGAVGSRLLMDMRHCRLSSSAFVVTAGCFALAVITQLGWILPTEDRRAVMLEEGCEMFGDLSLLLAMVLHARYVLLDAEGLLPRRAARSEFPPLDEDIEEEHEAEPSDVIDEWIKVEAAHASPKPKLRRKPPPEPEPEAESPVRRKLTKQERKVLQKRLSRERAERESAQKKKW